MVEDKLDACQRTIKRRVVTDIGFVQIDVTCADGLVTLATRKSERSQGEDELTVADAEPGNFKFHVNADYLSHAVKAVVPVALDL